MKSRTFAGKVSRRKNQLNGEKQPRGCLVSAVTVLSLLMFPHAHSASIQYGKVVSVSATTVDDDDGLSGAVKGGLLGKAIGPRRPGLERGVIAGAAIGAAAEENDRRTVYLYTVALIDGGSISISTEQHDIREGDCVSVEQGAHANIRRISAVHCEERSIEPPAHHAQMAVECDAAKRALMAADNDKDLNLAAKKVRILCED